MLLTVKPVFKYKYTDPFSLDVFNLRALVTVWWNLIISLILSVSHLMFQLLFECIFTICVYYNKTVVASV